MKSFILFALVSFFSQILLAQDSTSVKDMDCGVLYGPSNYPDKIATLAEDGSSYRDKLKTYLKSEYPKELKEQGYEGLVHVSFIVDKNGNTTQHTVLSTIHEGFNEVAINFIKTLKYVPAEKDGQSVCTEELSPVRFRITD